MLELLAPYIIRLGLLSLVFGVGVFTGYRYESRVCVKNSQIAQNKEQTAVLSKVAQVATINTQQSVKAQEVTNDQSIALEKANSAFSAMQSANNRLLHTLAGLRADSLSNATTRARLAAESSACSAVIGECGSRYQSMAAKLDECSIELSGWQQLFPAPDATAGSASAP